VSLWQGDVTFQNLELKLDVLEEELQLPFTFLSGHINDLKISIPWTKINSEPINVTINTIGKWIGRLCNDSLTNYRLCRARVQTQRLCVIANQSEAKAKEESVYG